MSSGTKVGRQRSRGAESCLDRWLTVLYGEIPCEERLQRALEDTLPQVMADIKASKCRGEATWHLEALNLVGIAIEVVKRSERRALLAGFQAVSGCEPWVFDRIGAWDRP